MSKIAFLPLPFAAFIFLSISCSGIPKKTALTSCQQNDPVRIPVMTAPDIRYWDSIIRAFSQKDGYALLRFSQAWLPEVQDDFCGGTVRIGYQGSRVFILANLEDDMMTTKATKDNENLWALGDVFEVFIRDLAFKKYHEFHASPNGLRLQISFPSEAFYHKRKFTFNDHKIKEVLYAYRVRKIRKGWQVYLEIDSAKLFGEKHSFLPDREWLMSFSRYDYTRGKNIDKKNIVFSSTSRHQPPRNFHDQKYWRRILFLYDFPKNIP
ncbi:MAG: hypothetical protein ACK5NG_09115 [Chthoniobacterales bacterium]